jgi:hypothetical protein
VLWLGPVAVPAEIGDPSFRWTSDPNANGLRGAAFSGSLFWPQVHQLGELVDNADRQVTIGGKTGVLEYVHFDDNYRGPVRGWYLFESFELGEADHAASTTGEVKFSLTCSLVGDVMQRRIVALRSARAKASDFGGTPAEVYVSPFPVGASDPDSVVSPGGTRVLREVDASSPHETARLTPDAEDDLELAAYIANVGLLSSVVKPVTAVTADGAPTWVTKRGGDCRTYDRRLEREVYGPSHSYRETTDVLLTNGLVRFWLGNPLLEAFLNVAAFVDGTWRHEGVIRFGRRLLGARLVSVTSDAATIALELERYGEAFVTLKRGEPMIRTVVPSIVTAPVWSGLPPTSRSLWAANGAGRFGKGLDGGGDAGTWLSPFGPSWTGDGRFDWLGDRRNPDVRLLWPPTLPPTAWTRVLWITPEKAAVDTGGAGYLTLHDTSPLRARAAQVWLDPVDLKVNLRMGAKTVKSPALSFAAGGSFMVAAGFSVDDGMTLSVRAPGGSVSHASDATATDPIVEAIGDACYYANFSTYGDTDYGGAPYGGDTLFPDGVVDNDMLFRRKLSTTEVEALAAATHELDGLPTPEGDLVWYAPYDVEPLPVVSGVGDGESAMPVDGWGITKGVVRLDLDGLEHAVVFARDETLSRLVDLHAQAAAETEQRVTVGVR